ncbi:MAG TPA: hypothetical protein PLU91_19505, partial [Verrucomicrobiota bacterium]|nr:hypothetical protein [Verrucomicrobiota bacterium]
MRNHLLLPAVAVMALLPFGPAPAGTVSMCDRSSYPAGDWVEYNYGVCGNPAKFALAWGNSGANDRARWNPTLRDQYCRVEHRYALRGTGNTSCLHSVFHDDGQSDYRFTCDGSGTVTRDLGDHWLTGDNDYFEVNSESRSGDTVADNGRFVALLDATYSSRQVDTSMYIGNVYYWKIAMVNASAERAWDGSDELRHPAGSITGPGWISTSEDRIDSIATAAGATASFWFNMRPTTIVTSEAQDFKMCRERGANPDRWFGEDQSDDANMRVTVTTSRKAPWLHDPGDTGAKKKGETVRFYAHGSSSFTGYVYSWDFDGAHSQGWANASQTTVTQDNSNDRLQVAITGGDPHIRSSTGLAINTSQVKYLAIRMWASGGSTAKLYWVNENGGESEARQYAWGISGDSQWHDYHIDLATSGTGWGGTITQLRLDPVDNGAASGQTVYIDYIRLYGEEDLSAKVWLGTANNNWNIANATAMSWDAGSHRWYYDYTITGNYPSTYYCAMHVYNDDGVAHCENNTGRKYGDDQREYLMANTCPENSNANYDDNAWYSDNTPTLQWNYSDADSNGQGQYRVQVDDNADFSSPVIDTGNVGSAAQNHTVSALGNGGFYWRVITQDGYNWSDAWSAGTAFRVDAAAPEGVSLGYGMITGDSIQVTGAGTDVDSGISASAGYNYSRDGAGDSGATGASYTWTGLVPNTEYTGLKVAVSDQATPTPNVAASSPQNRWTLSVAPGPGTVLPDSANPCANSVVTWTAAGFGSGYVQYYRYAFDKNGTYVFANTEPMWSGGTLQTVPDSAGTWYLHVKGYNGANVENGTYAYAVTALA